MESQQVGDCDLSDTNRINWKIGGAQGSGVDSSARIFSRACALAGLWVYGTREYYSNIKGLHSYFEVRLSPTPVNCKVDGVTFLASFDAETLIRHAETVENSGAILYNNAVLQTPIEKVDTINMEVRQRVIRRLESGGFTPDVAGILKEAGSRGIHIYPVQYDDIIGQTAKKLGETQLSRLNKIINVLAASFSGALLGLDRSYMFKAIEQTFASKQKIIQMNVEGAGIAYDFTENNFKEKLPYGIVPIKNSERIYISGNEAVALGKLVGGCRVQTYYPITPASDESEFLEAHEYFNVSGGKGSILVVQTEDEIAAITMATGAALTGARAGTSTSGPGFSLMVEGMGWAGINEVPVVITLYSRGGPSTGMPTRTEQGDLKFALNASHGEFPRIVICSGDVKECFYDAIRALNYAERYQLPVIHIVDKGLANCNVTITPLDASAIPIERGKLITPDGQHQQPYKRFLFTEDGISERAVLGMRGYRFWNTGDEHDEMGHINEEPDNRVRMMDKRMRKLETADKEIPVEEKIAIFSDQKNADLMIVSWGSSKGAILEVMELLKREGVSAEFLQIRAASPFPVEQVKKYLSKAKLIIDVEQNYSAQMAKVIAEKTGIMIENVIVKYNGRPVSLDELYQAIKLVISAPGKNRRVVLTHGA